MYVLIHHQVDDTDRFWAAVKEGTPLVPPTLRLHLSIPARDGTRATCLWEAESIEAVRSFVEPIVGTASTNEYREAENREGIALPATVPA